MCAAEPVVFKIKREHFKVLKAGGITDVSRPFASSRAQHYIEARAGWRWQHQVDEVSRPRMRKPPHSHHFAAIFLRMNSQLFERDQWCLVGIRMPLDVGARLGCGTRGNQEGKNSNRERCQGSFSRLGFLSPQAALYPHFSMIGDG